MKKTHDYIHHYRGYWSDGGKCRIRIYQGNGQAPVVICSQLQDNYNTSVTNMAEYLAAEVIGEHSLATPLTWIGSPRWSPLRHENLEVLWKVNGVLVKRRDAYCSQISKLRKGLEDDV